MEFTAKTVKEATDLGLAELGLTEESAIIKVIEEPVKGLFGKIKVMAKVDVSAKPEPKDKDVEFLEKLLEFLEISAEVKKSFEGEKEILTLVTDSSSNAIGYRGEVLDAMQTLTGAIANIGNKVYKKVVVDCENYRDRREDTLIKLAKKLEGKATEMRREVHLEPMSPFERRIIHTALADSEVVKTKSEGKEPNRYVVIVPNDLDPESRPYNAGGNRAKSGGRAKGGKDFKSSGRGGRSGGGNRRGNGGRAKREPVPGEKRKASGTISFGTFLGNSKNQDN